MNNPIDMLKVRLADSDMTQTVLADQIGISPQFLSEILNGKRGPSKTVLDFLGLEKVVTYRRSNLPKQLPAMTATKTDTDRRVRNRRRA